MRATELNLTTDFFTLLDLPRAQAQEAGLIDTHFREMQQRVHPDKHAHASPADQRLAMQWATRVNEAYQTLKSPMTRARYLLSLLGHSLDAESNTAMPAEFLMAQMELREAVADSQVCAGGTAIDQLQALETSLRDQMRDDHARLEALIDREQDYAAAAQLVRQLMFQEKLLDDIDLALDAALT